MGVRGARQQVRFDFEVSVMNLRCGRWRVVCLEGERGGKFGGGRSEW